MGKSSIGDRLRSKPRLSYRENDNSDGVNVEEESEASLPSNSERSLTESEEEEKPPRKVFSSTTTRVCFDEIIKVFLC